MFFSIVIVISLLFLILLIIGYYQQEEENKAPTPPQRHTREINGMTFEYSGEVQDEGIFHDLIDSLIKKGHFLIIDTETNGLPFDFNDPPEDTESWPRLLSIAYLLLDEHYRVVDKGYHLIKPDFELDPDALRVNKLTEEELQNNGVDIQVVLDELIRLSKETKYLIAHNMNFDLNVIQAEYIRAGQKKKFSRLRKRCTMKSGTPYCEIPNPYRPRGFKWPNLTELIQHCYFDYNADLKIHGTHHAMNDTWLAAKAFVMLHRLGYIDE